MNKQAKIVNELKAAFSNADTFDTVDQNEFGGGIVVCMSLVHNYNERLVNKFRVGPRGGLKIEIQQFNANGKI